MSAIPPEVHPVDRIVRPSSVDIRDVWLREDRNFTPWLAENIDLLSEAIGFELQVEKVEQSVPETLRSLDILASSKDRLVAIENQYGVSDHDHLTRGLAYAVGLEASALVVVAERHLNEFRAIARYLNRCAEAIGDDGVRVYLVQVSIDRVADYFVPRLEVVEKPIAWLASARVEAPVARASVDEFLAAVSDPDGRSVFAEASRDWEVASRTIGLSAHALALYIRNPAKGASGSTAVFTLHDTGQCAVNRGYLLDSGAFAGEEDQVALDDALDEFFPSNRRAATPYFASVAEPTAAAIRQFALWLDQRLTLLA